MQVSKKKSIVLKPLNGESSPVQNKMTTSPRLKSPRASENPGVLDTLGSSIASPRGFKITSPRGVPLNTEDSPKEYFLYNSRKSNQLSPLKLTDDTLSTIIPERVSKGPTKNLASPTNGQMFATYDNSRVPQRTSLPPFLGSIPKDGSYTITNRDSWGASQFISPRTEYSMSFFSEEKPLFSQRLEKELSDNFMKISQIEASKVSLSKELYYSKAQREIKAKMLEELKDEYKNYVGHVRKIHANKKEHMEVVQKTRLHLKIDVGENNFPMNVKLDVREGDYEILVSRKIIPDESTYDSRQTNDHFTLNYNKNSDYKQMFFTIIAFSNVNMTMVVSFSNANNRDSGASAVQPRSTRGGVKQNKFVFVDPFPDFDSKSQKYPTEIEEIMAKRRQRMYQLSGNKNIIKLNIGTASSYPYVKTARLEQYSQIREKRTEEAIQKKEKNREDFKKKQFADTVNKELRHIYAAARKEREERKQQMKIHNENWFLLLNVHLILKKMLDFKTAAKMVSYIKKIKEDNAITIQKAFRMYQARQEHSIEVRTGIIASNALLLHANFLNFPAKKKAKECAGSLFRAALKPLLLRDRIKVTISNVNYIKRRWKSHREILNARVTAIGQMWDGYILDIINNSKKKKDSKLASYVYKITPTMRNKTLKAYLSDRIKEFTQAYKRWMEAKKRSNMKNATFIVLTNQDANGDEESNEAQDGKTSIYHHATPLGLPLDLHIPEDKSHFPEQNINDTKVEPTSDKKGSKAKNTNASTASRNISQKKTGAKDSAANAAKKQEDTEENTSGSTEKKRTSKTSLAKQKTDLDNISRKEEGGYQKKHKQTASSTVLLIQPRFKFIPSKEELQYMVEDLINDIKGGSRERL